MMPLPPPDDTRGVESSPPPEDNEQISRVGRSRSFSDPKSTLEDTFQDSTNGPNLTSRQRFFQGKSFIRGGINFLDQRFPNDEKLHERLESIEEDANSVKPPHPTLTYGISQNAAVLVIKTPRADASVDEIPLNLSGMINHTEERDYADVLDQLLDIVWEVAALLIEYKLWRYEIDDGFDLEEDETSEEDEWEDDEKAT